MLTKITIKNFKRFDKIEVELASRVVFIGPNNSGKTTALQALALWDAGLKKWLEKKGDKKTSGQRRGVTIGSKDLIALPIPNSSLLWRNLHVRDAERVDGKQKTTNVCIEIVVEGILDDKEWSCGLEFDYAREEYFYCRPLRLSSKNDKERMPIPSEVKEISVAFLPPMSGLSAIEHKQEPGTINVMLGEGRTAEVLRNICLQVCNLRDGKQKWANISKKIEYLFGAKLNEPVFSSQRGEITMNYKEGKNTLDISASGRGLQQTLLLLSYITLNPNSVLLLDEPDAHLEILRQRQTYNILSNTIEENNSQMVVASHSEVILNEAADRDVVVAFVGKPHRIDDRGSQVLKSLKEIGFEQYYQAEQTGWVLYLEGSTDLAILKALADKLNHPAAEVLEKPFVRYVQQPSKAREHFFGLKEAKKDLVGFALFDQMDVQLNTNDHLLEYMWKNRKEIENYIFTTDTLFGWTKVASKTNTSGPLFESAWVRTMNDCIKDLMPPVAFKDPKDRWWNEVKASEFMDRIYDEFFKKLKQQNLMKKTDYHVLAKYMPPDQVDPEVKQVLDAIYNVSKKAKPN